MGVEEVGFSYEKVSNVGFSFSQLSVSSKKFQALKRELEQATLLELVQSSPGLALAAAQSGNDEAGISLTPTRNSVHADYGLY